MWIERLIVLGLGAAAHAVISPRCEAESSSAPSVAVVSDSECAEPPSAHRFEGSGTEPIGDNPAVEDARSRGAEGPENPSVPPDDASASPDDPDDAMPSRPDSDADAAAPPSPVPRPRSLPRPRGAAPQLRLARMPGTNRLRAGSKWDPQRGAWVLTRAFEVPAASAHVAAFYRKALEDEDLEVSTVTGAPDAEGAVPLYIKGRSTDDHAHITIRQDVGELRTRVRVIWRVFVEREGRVAP